MDETIQKINALCAKAKERIPSDISDLPCAEIFWMTDEEVTALHELKMQLPTYGRLAQEARSRVREKHRLLRSKTSPQPQGSD